MSQEKTSVPKKVLIGKIFAQPNGNYYPFGKEARSSATVNKPKENFTGHQLDPESSLLYAGARYYNTDIGRWTSVDPLSQYPSGYVYCSNNPIAIVDPSGLEGVHSADAIKAFDSKISDWQMGISRWTSGATADGGQDRKKQEKIAPAENVYPESVTEFGGSRLDWIPTERDDIGNFHATYNVRGTVTVRTENGKNLAIVSASGQTTLIHINAVEFYGYVQLKQDGVTVSTHHFQKASYGNIYQTGRLPVGTAQIPLPKTGHVELSIKVEYLVQRDAGIHRSFSTFSTTVEVPAVVVPSPPKLKVPKQ